MPLTLAQKQALKADIAANTNPIPAGRPFAGTAINALPNSPDANLEIALWYSTAASPTYRVWSDAAAIKSIRAAVNLQNFTPADAVPAASGTTQNTNEQLVYQNRALVCQLKQANAIFLIQGEGAVDCAPLQLRQSFNDCMTLIPSGSAGANQNAGWGTSAAPGAVRLAMQRAALNIEKLFAAASTAAPNAGNVGVDPRGGTTNPDTLVYIGGISGNEITEVRELP